MDKLITRARPEHLDLAVPVLSGRKSQVNLKQIVQGWANYPKPGSQTYAMAANVEYRNAPDGACVSLLAEGGTVWVSGNNPTWPMFAVSKDNKANILPQVDAHLAKQSRLAFSAGPWLVHNGAYCNQVEQIRAGGYTGLMEGSFRERAGIGVTTDGLVVHIAFDSATLAGLAVALKEEGCKDAIALDGGGSVGVVDGTGKILLGYSSRKVCSALIFKGLINSPAVKPIEDRIALSDDGQKILFHYAERATGQATKNFTWSEFASRRTVRVFIAVYLVELCQRIRDVMGGPLRVNSAYRDVLHNAAVGGEPDSYHVYGMAVDIDATVYGVERIVRAAREFGWKGGLGRYKSFVHLDIGPEREWSG